MKTTRQYFSGCTWCNATGFVSNPQLGYSTLLTMTCPVCNGLKVILISEIIEEGQPSPLIKEDPLK